MACSAQTAPHPWILSYLLLSNIHIFVVTSRFIGNEYQAAYNLGNFVRFFKIIKIHQIQLMILSRVHSKGEVNPKKHTKMYKGKGVFFKECTYAHELFKVGISTIFPNLLFCFLKLCQIIRLDFLHSITQKTNHLSLFGLFSCGHIQIYFFHFQKNKNPTSISYFSEDLFIVFLDFILRVVIYLSVSLHRQFL